MGSPPIHSAAARARQGSPQAHGGSSASGTAMFSGEAWNALSRSLGLSGREAQIVRGVFEDLTEVALAVEFGISRRTIHTHCERLYRKLGVTGRVKLVLRVTREFHALITSPGKRLPPLCANYAAGHCHRWHPRLPR